MAKDIDVKIDDLAAMVARGFADTATKADIAQLQSQIDEVKENMATKADVNNFVGVVRADYDSLAARVKDIEKEVLH
ncbi:MAG: hypothetical protein WAX57_02295 [Minisyncoccia bacterium]